MHSSMNIYELLNGYICDAAQVWGGPRATEHTKNASCRGGRAAK